VSPVATATKRRGSSSRRPPPGPASWWGPGKSPLEIWPGVTIEIPAVWVPLVGHRRIQRSDGDGGTVHVWLRSDGSELADWHGSAGGRWESPCGTYYFDAGIAQNACDFFPTLLAHHMGEFAGLPFELLEYQAKLLTRPIFGWKQAIDGLRRFRKVFAFLPKGAGKSPWGSGTALYLTIMDDEAAAEVYAVAADKNQARVVHTNAKIMVEESPDLLEECEVLKDSIYHAASRSMLQVLSSDAATKHGFRPHAVIFDEMHAQRNRDLYEALKKSMVKRRQPLMVIITHAGDDDEGICYEEYEYAKGVLAGSVIDPTCLPVIFEMTPDDDWTDPVVWRRVNPGHGITVKTAGIAIECAEAQAEPRKLNDFLRYHGNRWVNQAVAWIPIDWWDACNEPLPSDEELAQLACAVGIDSSQKIDLASTVAVFRQPIAGKATELELVNRDDETGEEVKRTVSLNYRIILVPMFWLPEETLKERVRVDRVPYDQWRAEKMIEATEGFIIDADAIVKYTAKTLPKRFPKIKEAQIGYDPAFATEIGRELRDTHGMLSVEVLQNYKYMTEACQVFEALVRAGRVVHGGHRVLRWNVENVAIKRDDAGRIRPVKPKKNTKRIDGVVASLMGLRSLIATPEPAPSVYLDRGVRSLGDYL